MRFVSNDMKKFLILACAVQAMSMGAFVFAQVLFFQRINTISFSQSIPSRIDPTFAAAATGTTASIFGGDLTVTGTSTFTGSSFTINARAMTSNVVNKIEINQTNGTTTPCAVQNTSGASHIILVPDFVVTSSTSAGVVGLNMGTSTDAFTTSTSPVYNNAGFARSGVKSTTNMTSTNQGGGIIWEAGDWFVWKTATSVNSGECALIFH